MINDKTKIILGKLFQRYLNNSNHSTLDIEFANISSISTLYASFKGEIIKNNQFYLNYCKFFNHEYKQDTGIDLWLNDFIYRMIHAFDYFEEDNFEELYNEFVMKLGKYKEYVIYYEYYQVIQSLFNYYLKNEYLRLEEVEDYLNLINIDLLPKELSIYLLDYMFRSNWNYIGNKKLTEILVDRMESIDESHYIAKYQKGFLNKSNCNFIVALNCFNQCRNESVDKNNKYREIQSLLGIYSVYRNTDSLMEKETANELLKLKKETQLLDTLKHNINYNVGMQDYLEKRYERAYELFNENLICYNSLFTLLFQCSICSRLNIDFPEKLFSKEIENRYDFICLDYFRKKYNKTENERLAKYVLNTIIPKILKDEEYRNPYWNMFEYEMHEMANKDTKLRKYYVSFMKVLKKHCKDA